MKSHIKHTRLVQRCLFNVHKRSSAHGKAEIATKYRNLQFSKIFSDKFGNWD